MIDDREIWACALSAERSYGNESPRHIAERIGTLTLEGDVEGVATWKRIAVAVDQLRGATVQS